jgi:Ca-activated chloride channel homolog
LVRRISNQPTLLILSLILLLAATALTAGGQDVPTIHTESHLIDTTLSVHDSEGRLLHNLAAGDFTVVEDGVPQTIRFFTHDMQQPLSIGLLVDASDSQSSFVKEHDKAIQAFLHQILTPQDQAFAVCFGNHLRLVSDFTASPAAILDGLHRFDKGDRSMPELGPKVDRALGTALHDAVFHSIAEKLAPIHDRRKILLLFTDGEENSSGHDLLDSIEAAQNADVLVYAIRFSNLEHGQITTRGQYGSHLLDHLTAQTGGKVYDSRATHLEDDFADIADELRSLYAVAYQSSNLVRDGTFRKVVIQTTHPGATVRARSGYYAR